MLLDEVVNVQFVVKVKQSFQEVTKSEATKRAFATQFERDIAQSLGIEAEHIRVLEIADGSVNVKFIITSPGNRIDVEQWANELSTQLATPHSSLYSGKVTSAVQPGKYDFGFVPVFHRFQLSAAHFEAKWNMDYTNKKPAPANEKRGSHPFYPPAGWYRHALKVDNKYSDKTWLGMNNSPGTVLARNVTLF